MMSKYISRRQALKKMGSLAATPFIPSFFSRPNNERETEFPNIITGHASKKPNILWITLEGVPLKMLSCYGSTLIDTPNIDRIASEGMQFNNAFCTNALCAPSRATMLTGKYSHKNGVLSNDNSNYGGHKSTNKFRPSEQTFPKILQRNGYQTGTVGKWHLRSGGREPSNPGKAGFDYFIFKRGAGGPYYNPDDYLQNPAVSGRTDVADKSKIIEKSYPGYITDNFTDFALQGMEQFDQPFLMMAQFFNAHRPFNPPHKYEDLYKGQHIPEPGTFWDHYEGRASAAEQAHMRIQDMQDFNPPDDLTGRQRRQWSYQQLMKNFMGAMKSMDDNIGRLLDYLDDNNLTENTIVVLTSDHGFFLGEHGWFDKRFMYEESIRVPWLIRYPGHVEAGTQSEAMVADIDDAPTILDLVDLDVPADMQGESLKLHLEGDPPNDWRDSYYYHYYEFGPPHWVLPHYGVRTERYKLIYYYTINEWELFDLQKDPDEMDNLFIEAGYDVQPGYEKVVQKLVAELKRLRKKYDDTNGKPLRLWPTKYYN